MAPCFEPCSLSLSGMEWWMKELIDSPPGYTLSFTCTCNKDKKKKKLSSMKDISTNSKLKLKLKLDYMESLNYFLQVSNSIII